MLRKVKIKSLMPGMRLVNHLTYKGKKILSAGVKLKQEDIGKIQQLGIPENIITVELPLEIYTNKDGSLDAKSTFTNLVMNLRKKNKK